MLASSAMLDMAYTVDEAKALFMRNCPDKLSDDETLVTDSAAPSEDAPPANEEAELDPFEAASAEANAEPASEEDPFEAAMAEAGEDPSGQESA